MSYSLNEVEATARKAVRGAGYAWGVADEAGKAVRWLCANDVDGCAALAAFLDGGDGASMCPFTTGCALADKGRTEDAFDTIAQPILLMPFLARTAKATGQTLQLSGDTFTATTDGDLLCLQGAAPPVANVKIQPTTTLGTPNKRLTRATPDLADWATLNTFAHRTYAPATEESRLKGAG